MLLLNEIGLSERLTKGNTQLIRRNYFSLMKMKLVYFLTRKTRESNRLPCFAYFFFIMRHHTAKTSWCWFFIDSSAIYLVNSFSRKMAESSDFMYFPIFMVRNMIPQFYLCIKWTKFNCEFRFIYRSPGTTTKLKQHSQFLVNSDHFR